LGLGRVLGESKNFVAAVRALDQALQLSPRNLQARVNRGVVLIGLGRNDEAIADLRRAAGEHPTTTIPLLRLGEFLSNEKSFAASADAYAEAARRDTNNVALRHRLAIELSRAARTNEAEAEFRRVIQQNPNFVAARLDFGVALAQQARFQEALPEFEAALKLQPTNTQAQAYLQQVRARVGQNEGR
jgi:tetratricopeptide (TPR) repeat protein